MALNARRNRASKDRSNLNISSKDQRCGWSNPKGENFAPNVVVAVVAMAFRNDGHLTVPECVGRQYERKLL